MRGGENGRMKRSEEGRKAVKKRKGTYGAVVRGVEEEMRRGSFDTPYLERRKFPVHPGGEFSW